MPINRSLRRLTFVTAAICLPALSAPIFNPGSPPGSNPGCNQNVSPPQTAGGTLQVAGNGSCAASVFPGPPGPIPTYNGFFAPISTGFSGTGSGVFDGSFYPIGFTSSISRGGPFQATFQINGNTIRTGTGQGLWNVAPELLGQTLSTWGVTLVAPGENISGTGMPGLITKSFAYCIFFGANQLCNNAQNNSPSNPILPSNPSGSSSSGGSGSGGAPTWVFPNVPSGRWFDPPFVNGFTYVGTGGTLFDRITLPTGYGSAFTVWTGPGFTNSLGTFAAGASVDFIAGGVSAFEVRDIQPSVDAALPDAFPLQIFFEGGVDGSFTQTGIESQVPEPATWLMLTVALPLLWRRSRR